LIATLLVLSGLPVLPAIGQTPASAPAVQPAPANGPAAKPTAANIIVEIRVQGNRQVSERSVLTRIRIRAGQPFDAVTTA
jgi:outer membrane protein assembly factor BamA